VQSAVPFLRTAVECRSGLPPPVERGASARTRYATRISQTDIAVTSSRCMRPARGPAVCAKSSASALAARSIDQRTPGRQAEARPNVRVRMNMPAIIAGKDTREAQR
jgi:hypothetical protein